MNSRERTSNIPHRVSALQDDLPISWGSLAVWKFVRNNNLPFSIITIQKNIAHVNTNSRNLG